MIQQQHQHQRQQQELQETEEFIQETIRANGHTADRTTDNYDNGNDNHNNNNIIHHHRNIQHKNQRTNEAKNQPENHNDDATSTSPGSSSRSNIGIESSYIEWLQRVDISNYEPIRVPRPNEIIERTKKRREFISQQGGISTANDRQIDR